MREANLGLLYGVAAYLFWGVIPIYWKQLSHISALELLAHRVVWAVFAFGAAVMVRRRGDAVRAALRDRRVRWTLVLSAALLSINWLTFIYAINTNRLLHASLGYFINPLVLVQFTAIPSPGERHIARHIVAKCAPDSEDMAVDSADGPRRPRPASLARCAPSSAADSLRRRRCVDGMVWLRGI